MAAMFEASAAEHHAALSLMERRQAMKDLFDVVDADESGELDAEEIVMLLEAFGRSSSDSKTVIKAVDADNSGAVGFDEFVHLVNTPMVKGSAAVAAERRVLICKTMETMGIPKMRGANILRLLTAECEAAGVAELFTSKHFIKKRVRLARRKSAVDLEKIMTVVQAGIGTNVLETPLRKAVRAAKEASEKKSADALFAARAAAAEEKEEALPPPPALPRPEGLLAEPAPPKAPRPVEMSTINAARRLAAQAMRRRAAVAALQQAAREAEAEEARQAAIARQVLAHAKSRLSMARSAGEKWAAKTAERKAARALAALKAEAERAAIERAQKAAEAEARARETALVVSALNAANDALLGAKSAGQKWAAKVAARKANRALAALAAKERAERDAQAARAAERAAARRRKLEVDKAQKAAASARTVAEVLELLVKWRAEQGVARAALYRLYEALLLPESDALNDDPALVDTLSASTTRNAILDAVVTFGGDRSVQHFGLGVLGVLADFERSTQQDWREVEGAEVAVATAVTTVEELCEAMESHCDDIEVLRAAARRLLGWLIGSTDLDEDATAIALREESLQTIRPVNALIAAKRAFPTDVQLCRDVSSALAVLYKRIEVGKVWEGVGVRVEAPLLRTSIVGASSGEHIAEMITKRGLTSVGKARLRKTAAEAESTASTLYTAFLRTGQYDIAERVCSSRGFDAVPPPLRDLLLFIDQRTFSNKLWLLFALIGAAAQREFVQFTDLILAKTLAVVGDCAPAEIHAVLKGRALPESPPLDPTANHRVCTERFSGAVKGSAGSAQIAALLKVGVRSGFGDGAAWACAADRIYFDLAWRAEAETRVLWGTSSRGSRGTTAGTVERCSSEDHELYTSANLHCGVMPWKSRERVRAGVVEYLEIDLGCDAVLDRVVVRSQTAQCEVRICGEAATTSRLRVVDARHFGVDVLPWGSSSGVSSIVERVAEGRANGGAWLSKLGPMRRLRVEARHCCAFAVEVGVVELVIFGRGLRYGSDGLANSS